MIPEALRVTLVLDLDGVVVTGNADGKPWYENLERDLGIRPPDLQKLFFRSADFSSLMVGQADLFEALRHVWPQLRCAASVEAFVDYWFSSHSGLDRDVLAAVDRVRHEGKPSFLATNQEHHRARYVWNTLGLSEHFDGMIYSAELGAQKPNPEFFARAVGRLPARKPGEILFLDDSLANIEAAARSGWNALHYRNIEDLRRALG
jgi:putative hydrolase of the HAD superfamily